MTILNWWLDRFPRYEFLVEYFLFLIPMVIHLPRRKHFFLRLLPMLAISIILSKQWNSTWASILPLYILRYLILFGLGIAVTTQTTALHSHSLVRRHVVCPYGNT